MKRKEKPPVEHIEPLPTELYKSLNDLRSLRNNAQYQSVSSGCRLWRRIDVSNSVSLYKVTTPLIKLVSSEAVVESILDVKKRREWDIGLLVVEQLNSSNGSVRELYLEYNYSSITSHSMCYSWPRYFLQALYCHKETDGAVIIAQHSLDSTKAAQYITQHNSRFSPVKAELNGGFIIERVHQSIKVTFYCEYGIGGYLQYLPAVFSIPYLSSHLLSISSLVSYLSDTALEHSIQQKQLTMDEEEVPLLSQSTSSTATTATAVHSQSNSRASTPSMKQEEEEEASESEEETEAAEADEDEVEQEEEHSETVEEKRKRAVDGVPPQFIDKLDKTVELLMQYDAESDWTYVTTENGIKITKKELSGSGVSCAKGEGEIPAPVPAILELFKQFDRRAEWDSMFKESQPIEVFNDYTLAIRMAFKGVWPVSARDFCNLTHTRELSDCTVALATSVVHPKCPEVKGYVRAELIVGGYILRPHKDNPMVCSVSYITQTDLKGNIPTSLMNQVSVKQPMCIDGIRKVLAAEDMSKYAPLVLKPNPPKPLPKPKPLKKKKKQQQQQQPEANNVSNNSVEPVPGQRQSISNSSSEIDFSAVNEEAAAAVDAVAIEDNNKLIEAVLVKAPSDPAKYREIIEPCISALKEAVLNNDGWKSITVKDDVLILRKEPTSGYFYAFKGIGEIKAPPQKIKELCIDVTRAKEWDALLKEAKAIETIDQCTQVVHLMFQTRTCLLKTSRDFCILYHWVQPDKDSFMIVGKSIAHPLCPPNKEFIRGEVLASGYHIQLKEGTTDTSVVTYVSQVDLKGLPVSLINIVGLRKVLTGKKTAFRV